jgi:hypothetical protein
MCVGFQYVHHPALLQPTVSLETHGVWVISLFRMGRWNSPPTEGSLEIPSSNVDPMSCPSDAISTHSLKFGVLLRRVARQSCLT